MKKFLIIAIIPFSFLFNSCTKVYVTPNDPTPVNVKTIDKIEFHVFGNATAVRVRYSSGSEGLNQVVTTLPFQTVVSNSNTFIFLSLEAQAISFPATVTNPFIGLQIFVNGELFREASTVSPLLETISASGTFRR